MYFYAEPALKLSYVLRRAVHSQFLIGDGQVSLGNQVIKPNARKVRQIKEGVICGFAGATADAMTLLERLEMKLQEHPETLRACVEMAKGWRMDKYLRRLEAIMIVCDANVSLTLTGNGDVIEPVDGVIGIGSGGLFATAAARALLDVPGMDAEAIGRKAMTIAADSERLASLPSGDRLASREAPRLQECMPNPDLCACFCCSLCCVRVPLSVRVHQPQLRHDVARHPSAQDGCRAGGRERSGLRSGEGGECQGLEDRVRNQLALRAQRALSACRRVESLGARPQRERRHAGACTESSTAARAETRYP